MLTSWPILVYIITFLEENCFPKNATHFMWFYIFSKSISIHRHIIATYFICEVTSSSYVALQIFYRVLALSTNSFHLLLSWARVYQFGTFNFCISFLISSTQRAFGLPIGLLEMGFQEYIAFTILLLCILSMWPSQLSLCARMKFIVFLRFIISSSSWLVSVRYIPFYYFIQLLISFCALYTVLLFHPAPD